MASLGRLTNAVVAATNENTLQLAGFNIDFSLLKVEAPKEFMGLGAVLSRRRKINAEDGPLHRTARKLGALFEQIIPSTPNLIRAYGERATAIFQTPGINPQGTKKDGPFESFVGADGASLWAAATSGHSAVAVYLLACMLARKWNAQVATSIWVEIVAERKQEVENAFKEGNVASMTVILAAGQDISREELSLWDDSARAWLQSADTARTSQLKQLELIMKNVDAPISSGTNPYTNVVSAWKQAMVGLEQILLGVPQQISDGSVLLSLSAWHIFPDLLVLGSKTVNVKFKDELVPGSGVVTIGLRNTDLGQGRTQWSLALSHLRYYGDPVAVTSGDIKSRVSMDQLHLAAFGTVMSSWGASMEEIIPLATWFTTLWTRLEEAPDEDREFLCNGQLLHNYLNWLYILVKAAKHILACKSGELEVATMIVGFGHRRGSKFLGVLQRPLPPFFGLCNRAVLLALQKESNVDRGICFLRELAKVMEYKEGDAFISFEAKRDDTKDRGPHYKEYATAVPHSSDGKKRNYEGVTKQSPKFWRSVDFSLSIDKDESCCECHGECGTLCFCAASQRFCAWSCYSQSSFDVRHTKCQNSVTGFDKRVADIISQGEFCGGYGRSIHGPFTEEGIPPKVVLEWDDPPLLFSNLPGSFCGPPSNPTSASHAIAQPCCCYDPCHLHWNPHNTASEFTDEPEVYHSVLFDLSSYTKDSSFGLWLKRRADGQSHLKLQTRPSPADLLVDTNGATNFLPSLNPSGLLEYMQKLTDDDVHPDSAMRLLLRTTTPLETAFLRALDTLFVASDIYEKLDGATIPLGIMSMNLDSARWMPPSVPQLATQSSGSPRYRTNTPVSQLSRSQALACIMMFESGTLNLQPNNFSNVMAISSGNSIFVPKALLSDPFEEIQEYELQRFVGNLGKPGITLMVCPQNPRVRELSDDFRVVRHAKYDFKREDNFKETTLHLSFTDWKLPLDTGTESWGNISKDVHYVESVVSVHDRGEWVADIDLVNDCDRLWRLVSCSCTDQEKQVSKGTNMITRLTSVDSWDELLDSPNGIGVFRAKGNWAARLAAASILGRRSNVEGTYDTSIIVGPTVPCLKCAHRIASHGPRRGLALWRKGSFFFID